MLDPVDDEVRKKKQAENPLAQYFGGQSHPPAQPVAPTPRQPTPQAAPAAPAATNVGNAANTARPGPTNFTNFSRVQAANRDVSKREATAYGDRAAIKADKAKQALDALRARFSHGVNAGTVGAAEAGFAGQPTSGDGLLGESTRPTMGGGLTSDQMYANADKAYTGPAGLGEIDGADATVTDMLGAEQNLNALGGEEGLRALIQAQNGAGGEGTSGLSSALIGGAGRKDFDALRARFHPQTDFDAADTAAISEAKTAADTSKKNAADWRTLGDTTKGVEEQAAAAAAAAEKRKTDAASKAKLDKQIADDFRATVKDEGTLGAKTLFEYLDPTNYIGGGKRSAGMDWLGKTFGEDYRGNISWQNTPLDRDVFSQMDDAQWAELSGLTGVAQRNWINTRAAQLKNGTGRPRGTYKGRT